MFHDSPPKILPLADARANDPRRIVDLRAEYRESFERDLAKPDWTTVILSAESLSVSPRPAIARLVDWVRRHVGTLQVVAFVRHPVDWVRSVIQERLKMGYTLEQLYAQLPAPRWQNRLTPWIDAVGIDNFKVVSFESAISGAGIVPSFCDAAALPYEEIRGALTLEGAQTNTSMSLEAALLISSLNRQRPLLVDGRVSQERSWRGTDCLMAVPGRPFRLVSADAVRARELSRGDVEWLNGICGTDYYQDVFDDTPLAEDLQESPVPNETIDALARMISDLGNAVVGGLGRNRG
ncbi:MAG: hypothetical protein ACRD2X_19580 [Vicinamibacteraceae bacterium]